jgi:hypothetical protein
MDVVDGMEVKKDRGEEEKEAGEEIRQLGA